ncbi:MAG: Coenzyme F420 hydrogenase/dehydrogenase, beta subunit C-terminal domain [Lachnospiraceae bacterium]|nr:Coenzyme F420 hydrogenase/dehydrogenase, beta subunit C-terminal domain [Lachnospiraceae bacterium]
MVTLSEKEKCTGCTACYSSCPQSAILMVEDEEGFLYPVVKSEQCVSCGKCVRVCPVLQTKSKNQVIKSFVAINNNDAERVASSSGGVFSVIAKYILNEGGVVFGAAFDENFVVRHIAIENESDLYRLRMSKYVQSDITDTIMQVANYLKNGRQVLFSGTPCQIEGLNACIKDDNLILLDVVCHGVPSPKVFEKYKNAVEEISKSKITNIYFRSKIMGHHLSTISVELSNNKILHSTKLVKSFTKLWFTGLISRPSCHNCSFKTLGRVSDFTLFDAFNSPEYFEFKDDDYGASNVYIRTKKGLYIWNQIQNMLQCKETNCNNVNILDGDMIMDSAKIHARKCNFFKDCDTMPYAELIDKYIPYSKKEFFMDIVKRISVVLRLNKKLSFRKFFYKLKRTSERTKP